VINPFALLERLASNPVVHRGADLVFSRYARERARRLDTLSVAVQKRTLLRLVRKAIDTRFGRNHGFTSIRSISDFQQRVPVREYEAFWAEYWQPAFPTLADVTWPGPVPYLAMSSGTTTGSTKYIPVSADMLRSNRRAALTALAWHKAAYTNASLFSGRMFFLGGSTDLERLGSGVLAGDLSGIATHDLPSILRAFAFPSLKLAFINDWDRKLDLLAEESARLPIALVSGVPSWLLALFERLRQVTGRDNVSEIWPMLQLVVHGGTRFDPYRAQFRRMVGPGVRFLETYPASEGFMASEDPRHGLLRLIPDHGIFFEFVPVNEIGRAGPTRHTMADIVPGVNYAVVLTTCAGLWCYVLGDIVCFERREPPLLRFVGRTRQFLSAFGEHLIGEEVECAITEAAKLSGLDVVDFHIGPVFGDRSAGRHRWLVEFAQEPADVHVFARELDASLCRLNEDYRAHRVGDLAMRGPEIVPLARGSFAAWMRSQGKLGGQHKVPRMDNTGRLTEALSAWFAARPSPCFQQRCTDGIR
jgi:hypothetical protein